MALNLIISASSNVLLAILLYILEKKTSFSKISYRSKQVIVGVLFGFMAIFATTSMGGFDVGSGTIMNVRNAAPLCAGLIFGAPAGIIAGFIGGIYRYVASYTQIACSVSTIIAGMFVTAWLGILDIKTGLMKFANAWHNPPLIKKNGEKYEYMKARSGMFLAGMEGIKYRKNELQLNPGDRIYLYTDGVTEATDNSTELYGEQRLLDFVNSVEMAEPEKLCKLIKQDVDEFVGTAPQFDDITMLALNFDAITGDEKVVVIPNVDSREVVNTFADSLSAKLEIVPKIASKINIVFDEIYTNIINYSKASLATISYTIENGKLCLTFTDNGIPYNPLEAAQPDITLSAEEREIGGLGIFMVRKMTESMEYEYADNKNILKLVIALG